MVGPYTKCQMSSLKMWALQKGLQLESFFLKLEFDCRFSTFCSLKKYPKISGYLDRISKIWIMKKIDIQSIQVSMYPKKTDIHVSKYPCIRVSIISKYPLIQVSKKISIQDIQVSGYQKKVVSTHPYIVVRCKK